MFITLSLHDFFYNYYFVTYTIQQYLYSYVFSLGVSQSIVLSLILLFFGMLTVFTPCFVSILPLALSYFNSQSTCRFNLLMFVIGLMTNFIFFILFSNLFSSFVFTHYLSVLSYLLLSLVGLDLMGVLSFSILISHVSRHVITFFDNTYIFFSYFMGLVIGFSSLPCNTSILLIVTFLVRNVDNVFVAFLYLLIYLIGCIVPLILILNFKFVSINSSLLFFLEQSFSSLIGSLIFIYSCFSLLRMTST
uniref:Thiol:disulfide interchange protein n=1 Tax=Polysiphonia sp. TaxID=1967842 RepID=A0A1Z1MTN7_9FLOR|nr:thiol:disulfide interchange protein [Polysiphonia sp.]